MTQTKQHEQDVDVWVGKRFPLTIRRLGVNGHGIGYYKHKVCFVPGALPNEVVVAEVTRVLPRYLEAKIHRIRKRHEMSTLISLVVLNLKTSLTNNN